MLATYGEGTLAPGGVEGVSGLRLNGRQVNQEALRLRAAAAAHFPRGNRSTLIQFVAPRVFSTQLEAEQFAFGHFAELPAQDDSVFELADGSTEITYADAVLEQCSPVLTGRTVTVTYSFRAPLPTPAE